MRNRFHHTIIEIGGKSINCTLINKECLIRFKPKNGKETLLTARTLIRTLMNRKGNRRDKVNAIRTMFTRFENNMSDTMTARNSLGTFTFVRR